MYVIIKPIRYSVEYFCRSPATLGSASGGAFPASNIDAMDLAFFNVIMAKSGGITRYILMKIDRKLKI